MLNSRLVSDLQPAPEQEITGIENGQHYVDGFPVKEATFEFCKVIRHDRAFRGCKFGVSKGEQWSAVERVYVYFPDEIFCRGRIGYGDVAVNQIVYKYFIEAKSITNNKIHRDRKQHNMLTSGNINVALRKAKEHLRSFKMDKIAELTAGNLAISLRNVKTTTAEAESDAMDVLRGKLTRTGPLTLELMSLVKSEYMFKDDSVREAILTYADTIGDADATVKRDISITLVLVHPPHTQGAEHTITVQRAKDILNLNSGVFVHTIVKLFDEVPIEKYTPETLPDAIKTKISALNILDADTYVDGLGVRQSENIYYLAEDV